MAFGYLTPFTVQSGQVTGTLTDFPGYISLSGTQFKSVANGGRIVNSDSGKPADLAVYSSASIIAANKIPHEMAVAWDAVNGTMGLFVKIPSCADGTIVYVAYGDAAVTTTQENATGTWDSNFIGVYHFSDGSTLSVADSTGLHAGTNSGATATTGKIDGGAAFDGVNNHVNATYSADLGGDITVSAWVNVTTFASYPNYDGVVLSEVASYLNYWMALTSGGTGAAPTWAFALYDGPVSNHNPFASESATAGVFQHVVGVRDTGGDTLQVFVNGVSANGTVNDNTTSVPSYSDFNIGRRQVVAPNYPLGGSIDEVRISKNARTSAWILADYKTQSAPLTFWGQGAEQRISKNTRIRPLGMRRGMSRFMSFPA